MPQAPSPGPHAPSAYGGEGVTSAGYDKEIYRQLYENDVDDLLKLMTQTGMPAKQKAELQSFMFSQPGNTEEEYMKIGLARRKIMQIIIEEKMKGQPVTPYGMMNSKPQGA